MPDAGALSYFEHNAAKYADWTRTSRGFDERRAVFGALIGSCQPPAGEAALCLDLGCGSAPLGLLAAARGFDVVAIDGSAEMLALARRAQALTLPSIRDFRHAGLPLDPALSGIREFRQARLPLDVALTEELRGRADLIIASSVVEYLSELDATRLIAQCAQLLKPSGTALISFPNRRALYWRAVRPVGNRGPLRDRAAGVQQRQWTPEQVREVALASGLSLDSFQYFALPLQQYLDHLSRRRPAWLATLFVAVLTPAM